MSEFVWVDGALAIGSAIPAADRAFLHGVGLFETLGVWHGRLPLWDRHLERLERSADILGIRTAMPPGLQERAIELLRRNDHDVLRITLSAGDVAPRWVMTTRVRESARDPVVLAPSSFRRGPADPTAALKTTSRAFHELALREARAAGADEPLLLGRGTEVLESAFGNLFISMDGEEIRTPEEDRRFLCGVARTVLLEELGDLVVTEPIDLEDLARARGIWVTNALWGPRRARLVDDAPPGAPKLEDRLQAAWGRAVS